MKTRTLFFALALILSACNQQPINDADLLCVDEGQHAFKPSTFRWVNASVLAYGYEFGSSIAYDFTADADPGNDSDQCDWNKLGGLSADLFDNHENSLMVAFRYDLSGQLLLSPYYHLDGVSYWAPAPCSGFTTSNLEDPALPFLVIDPTAAFECHFNRQTETVVSVIVISGEQTLFFEKEFPNADFDRWREIGPWFGGNRPNPGPGQICLKRTAIAFE